MLGGFIMKRYLILIVLLAISMMLVAKPMYQVNLGIDMGGTHKFSVSGSSVDYDSKLGISPSFEVLVPVMPKLLVGGGLEYQLGRGIDATGADKVKYGFIPIYVVGKYAFLKDLPVTPEVIANVGYDMFTANDEYKGDATLGGGLCWAIGVGVNHPKGYNLQIMYRQQTGTLGDGVTVDVTQSNLSFLLGYRF
jgi:hypothetical protein